MDELLHEIQRVQREAELLHSEPAVQAAIGRLAQAITRTLADSNPLVLCVMTGGLVLTGCLLPRLDFALQLDFLHATRYRGDTLGHELEWRAYPVIPLQGRTVLLVDDIFDEGVTLACIAEYCRSQGAHQVLAAVLVSKRHDRLRSSRWPDFIGLEVPDRYVFGYGLDYKHYLRNLPAIYALHTGIHPKDSKHD